MWKVSLVQSSNMTDKSAKDSSRVQPLPPLNRKSLESGLITKGAVSENRSPETSCTESVNFDFDTIGGATLRKGTTLLGQSLGSAILGMHYFVDTVNAGTNTRAIIVSGTAAYYLNSNTWTSIRTGLTAGSKARFSTYLNFTFMVNGTEATAVWDGVVVDGFVTTGNAASAPKGTLIENFRGRMWIAGNASYPDRLYYSSVPTPVTTPVITWNTDPTTGQWIDISPSDGDQITGIQRYKTTMIVFKTNRIYRVFDIGQTDADPQYNVGTSSNESIVETKAGVYFHHASGFYQYNAYGVIQEISRPIQIDIIKQIPVSAYTSVTGWLEPDGDHICWSVGTVTVRGIVFTNLVLRYTISTMVWTHRIYPTQIVASIRRQPLYTDGTVQYATVGDSAGNVLEMNTGKTDNNSSIAYSIVHRWENIDGLLSTRKTIQTINFTHYGGAGADIAYQTETQDPDDLNNWTNTIGQFQTANTGINSANIKGRKMRLKLSGQSNGDPFTYLGYELIDVLPEFLQFEPRP